MNDKITIHTNTVTKRHHQVVLNSAHIRAMLLNIGIEIPARAAVQFHVPGGGDWSNSDIDISQDNPIFVSWETEEKNEA